MQIIAMLTMLIDHVGYVFFPDSVGWRIVGRLAFPIYAYMIVQGYERTRDRGKYLHRLLWLSAVAQIPFMIAFQAPGINVIATFSVCLAALILLDRNRNMMARSGILAAAVALLEILPFDYRAYALLLILMYRYASPWTWTAWHIALNVAYIAVHGWVIQIFSVFSTVLAKWNDDSFKVPRWLWRSFYPAHLAILGLFVITQ